MSTRSMCLPNSLGDATVSWEEADDDKMLPIIRAKMKAGITFFKMEPVAILLKRKVKIDSIVEIGKARSVIVSDNDFEELFKEGIISVASRDPTSEFKTTGVAKTAEEVAKNHTVGIRRQVGG